MGLIISLALPASVTELHWPQLQLMMSRNADMPRLSLFAKRATIGSDSPQGPYLREEVDARIQADLKSGMVPGKLHALSIYSMLEDEHCSNASMERRSSGQVRYEGGYFPWVKVFSQGGSMQLKAMEPDMRLQLFATNTTELQVSQLDYLDRMQRLSLDDESRVQLQPGSRKRESAAKGCSR